MASNFRGRWSEAAKLGRNRVTDVARSSSTNSMVDPEADRQGAFGCIQTRQSIVASINVQLAGVIGKCGFKIPDARLYNFNSRFALICTLDGNVERFMTLPAAST